MIEFPPGYKVKLGSLPEPTWPEDLPAGEARALIDEKVRQTLGISGDEFRVRWNRMPNTDEGLPSDLREQLGPLANLLRFVSADSF